MIDLTGDHIVSLITCFLTVLAGLVPFLIPTSGKRRKLEKAQVALDLYRARAKDNQTRFDEKTLSDRELEQEEILNRQVFSEATTLIEQTCVPLVNQRSRFGGLALAWLFFTAGFFMLMCVITNLLSIESQDQAIVSYIAGIIYAIIALCFLYHAVRFLKIVRQSRINAVQIDDQKVFRVISWDPIEQIILGLSYLIVPLASACVSFILFVIYIAILPLFFAETDAAKAAALVMQNCIYVVLVLAVIFTIVCPMHALFTRKKCDKNFGIRAKGFSLTFDDANLLLDWQRSKLNSPAPFLFAIRTAQNQKWFDLMYGEIRMQGRLQNDTTTLHHNGCEYWIVGNDKRVIRKRPLA